MKHLFTLLTVVLAATACGNSNALVAGLSSNKVALPTFTLGCSVSVLDDTSDSSYGIRSVRVTYSQGRVSMRIDQNDSDRQYAAVHSVEIVAADDYLAASWISSADDASFTAAEFARNIFEGELKVAGATVPVKCLKFVTNDRDEDEFSLACTPLVISSNTADRKLVIRDVVLSYEERELEMFINPTGDREILDLERASEVRVSDLEVHGEWESQTTRYEAISHDGDRFDASLNYNGISAHLVCWKI